MPLGRVVAFCMWNDFTIYLASQLTNTGVAMWTLRNARNRFSTVVEAALAGTPQEVSRRGKPAVVVLSAVEYRHLLAQARTARGSFVDHLMAFPADRVSPARVEPRDLRF